jgi:hypothetical protein
MDIFVGIAASVVLFGTMLAIYYLLPRAIADVVKIIRGIKSELELRTIFKNCAKSHPDLTKTFVRLADERTRKFIYELANGLLVLARYFGMAAPRFSISALYRCLIYRQLARELVLTDDISFEETGLDVEPTMSVDMLGFEYSLADLTNLLIEFIEQFPTHEAVQRIYVDVEGFIDNDDDDNDNDEVCFYIGTKDPRDGTLIHFREKARPSKAVEGSGIVVPFRKEK